MTRYQLLRAAERRVTPWRNGGGVTREVAACPANGGAEGFDWRVSIAEVAAPGPFSRFEGVDRVLAVIAGELRLEFDDGRALTTLTRDSAPCVFPGELPVLGVPVHGAVHDLNVMTRRDYWSGTTSVFAPSGVTLFEQVGDVTVLVFDRVGIVECDGACLTIQSLDALLLQGRSGELSVTTGGRVYEVRLSRKREQGRRPRAGSAPCVEA